jgi:hypothetical protein
LTPFAQLRKRSVAGDPVEPGRKRSGIGQPGHSAVDLKPNFLKQVVRRVVIPDHPGQEVAQPWLVQSDKFLERGSVPGLAPNDQDAPVNSFGDVGHSSPA